MACPSYIPRTRMAVHSSQLRIEEGESLDQLICIIGCTGRGVWEARVSLVHMCHYPVWPRTSGSGGGGHMYTVAALRPQRPHSCRYSHHICPLSRKNAPETQAATFLLGEAVCTQDGGTSISGCPSTRSAGHRCPRSLVGASLESAGVETPPISHRKRTRSPTPSSLLPRDSGLLPVTLILKRIWLCVCLIIQAGSHGTPAARCSEKPVEGLKVQSGKVTTQMLSCGACVTPPAPPPHHVGSGAVIYSWCL